jgi:hypothetical protein
MVIHRFPRRLGEAVAPGRSNNKDTPNAEDGRGRGTRIENGEGRVEPGMNGFIQTCHQDGTVEKAEVTFEMGTGLIKYGCNSTSHIN